jgi:hypothetical protein
VFNIKVAYRLDLFSMSCHDSRSLSLVLCNACIVVDALHRRLKTASLLCLSLFSLHIDVSQDKLGC